ncbi:DUF1707 domain-containing protein [Actinoplanes sp. GCM10030250]|uniref:DUF1707 SHOCT-like domain-containing protein n=1 Tax=Actinoplanes sp. GCM10030250 TaxID=3273376 RepID=UPI0036241C03
MDRHSRIRVSDADREGIVARLSAATAEGRLSVDEFSQRAGMAYASRTWGELARLVDDLPVPRIVYPAPPPAPSRVPLLALIFGVLSIPTFACTPLGASASLAAVVLGVLGIRGGDRAMAVAGLACGVVGLALQIAMILFFTAGMDSGPPPFSE